MSEELTEQKSVYNTKRLKLKLLTVLVSLSIINILILFLGPGLGGNYLKRMDSMLWAAPLGCITWGFIGGLLLALIPFKELPYETKYLPASLFFSILFNLLLLLIGISMFFE